MAISSVITQDIPNGIQQVIFNNPTEFDNILYSSGSMMYAAEPDTVLSKEDFLTYYSNKLQFYNALLNNFPASSSAFNLTLPASAFVLYSTSSPDNLEFLQLTSDLSTLVYTLNFDRVALTIDFTARPTPVTITLQEFLTGFQYITKFASQVQQS
ncbi:MAG TPA: hypothetical protein VFE71_06750 [Bacteroidales bacterium]|nr:hypothetical protein [Bacteroidales bacterium]